MQQAEGPDAVTAEALLEEAVADGDVALGLRELDPRSGTARSALRSRDFRRLWFSMFASNVGTWMQNVILGAYAYALTGSAAFVAYVGFAQLGPLLVLAPVGGLLADVMDRRRLLVVTSVVQLVFTAVLAVVVTADSPSRLLVFGVVLGIGVGNALNGPPLASLLPTLVPREDLPGAIALQSVQMNLSRVVGPAVGGVLLPFLHPSGVFALAAATYLFAVVGAVTIGGTHVVTAPDGPGLRRLLGGLSVARREPVVRSVLLTIAAISFFCLPFIGLMPVIAARNLGLDVTGLGYGLLYACFGMGAATGAIAVGSIPDGRQRASQVSAGLAAFGVALLVFALLRSAAPAYPVVFAVGFFYFATVTTLSTRLQQTLDDAVRGRVMALYMMAFGGTVPLGLVAGGAVAGASSVTAVVLGGAGVAGVLSVLHRAR